MSALKDAEFSCTLGDEELLFRHLHAEEELGRLPIYRVSLLRLSERESKGDKKPIEAKKVLGT